jgi:hypothetical protein
MASVFIYVTGFQSNAVETWLAVLSVINEFGGLCVAICDAPLATNIIGLSHFHDRSDRQFQWLL